MSNEEEHEVKCPHCDSMFLIHFLVDVKTTVAAVSTRWDSKKRRYIGLEDMK